MKISINLQVSIRPIYFACFQYCRVPEKASFAATAKLCRIKTMTFQRCSICIFPHQWHTSVTLGSMCVLLSKMLHSPDYMVRRFGQSSLRCTFIPVLIKIISQHISSYCFSSCISLLKRIFGPKLEYLSDWKSFVSWLYKTRINLDSTFMFNTKELCLYMFQSVTCCSVLICERPSRWFQSLFPIQSPYSPINRNYVLTWQMAPRMWVRRFASESAQTLIVPNSRLPNISLPTAIGRASVKMSICSLEFVSMISPASKSTSFGRLWTTKWSRASLGREQELPPNPYHNLLRAWTQFFHNVWIACAVCN
jgi:hypothetical protein